MDKHEVFVEPMRQMINDHDRRMHTIKMDRINAVYSAVLDFRVAVDAAKIPVNPCLTIRETYTKALQGDESCLKKSKKSMS